MRLLLSILIWAIAYSFEVTFQVYPDQQISVYPQEADYIPDSCECLKKIPVSSNDLIIRFKGLAKNESLTFQFSEPPIFEEYESLLQEQVNSTVSIPFKGIGSEKLLYFEYQNQKVEIHFSFVNRTIEESHSYAEPFDASYIILSACSSILILFLSNYARIHRFDARSIQWWFAFVYVAGFGVYIVVINFTAGNVLKIIQYVLIGSLSIVCSFFLVGELTYSAGLKCKLWRVESRDIAGVLATASLVFWRVASGNTWYVNDIFAIAIVSSLIKVFRIRSLKASLFFLIITNLVHTGVEIGYLLTGHRLGLKLINLYPSPLQLQLPTLTYFLLLFPSLIVNYCRRLDASFNISVYSIVATVCIAIALSLQIGIYAATSYSVQLPQAIFSVPLLLMVIFVVSSRRGQWSIVWYGGFHDKLAERVSLTKSVEWENLTKDMERNLLVN